MRTRYSYSRTPLRFPSTQALPLLRGPAVRCVAREFSLHMAYHRARRWEARRTAVSVPAITPPAPGLTMLDPPAPAQLVAPPPLARVAGPCAAAKEGRE